MSVYVGFCWLWVWKFVNYYLTFWTYHFVDGLLKKAPFASSCYFCLQTDTKLFTDNQEFLKWWWCRGRQNSMCMNPYCNIFKQTFVSATFQKANSILVQLDLKTNCPFKIQSITVTFHNFFVESYFLQSRCLNWKLNKVNNFKVQLNDKNKIKQIIEIHCKPRLQS